jgi:ribosomal protein L13
MKTIMVNPKTVAHKWILVDAAENLLAALLVK